MGAFYSMTIVDYEKQVMLEDGFQKSYCAVKICDGGFLFKDLY